MVVYAGVVAITIYKYEELRSSDPHTVFLSLISGDEPHYLAETSDIIYHHSVYVEYHFSSQFSGINRDPLMDWPVYYKDPNMWEAQHLPNGHWIILDSLGLPYFAVPSYFIGGIYGVMLTMTVLASLTSVLIFKFTAKLTTKKIGFFTTVVFSFFTIMISNSYKFLSDYPCALIGLAAMYLIFEKPHSGKYLVLTGAILGIGLFVKSYLVMIDVVLLPLVLIFTLQHKITWKNFFIFIGVFSLLTGIAGIHNYYIYGDVSGGKYSESLLTIFEFGYNHAPTGTAFVGYSEYRMDSLEEIFTGGLHGIFILSPVVMLFVLGIKSMWNKEKMLSVTSLLLSVTTVGGYLWVHPIAPVFGLGPDFRYFILVLYLMSFSFATAVQRYHKNWVFRTLLAILLFTSIRLAIGYALERRATHSHDVTKIALLKSVYDGLYSIFPSLGPKYAGSTLIQVHHPLTGPNTLFIIILVCALLAGAVIPFLGKGKIPKNKNSEPELS